MQPRPFRTVVLEHRLRDHTHWDWLLEPPPGSSRDPGLVTYRVHRPPAAWASAGRLELTPLPPHREAYLTFQGPVSRGRGTVRRVAAGSYRPVLWTPTARRLSVALGKCEWDIDIRPLGGAGALMVVTPAEAAISP